MKKAIVLLILIFTSFCCKAQTDIRSLDSNTNNPSCPAKDPNCYDKDINNDMNKMEGTWMYSNGSTEIIIKLKKIEHYQLDSTSTFEDLLVGEYYYMSNGNVIANSLTDFNSTLSSGHFHKIIGNIFRHRLPSGCIDNSTLDEIKIQLSIYHPTDEFSFGYIILRHIIENGVEKLEACIYDMTSMSSNYDTSLGAIDEVDDTRIPIPDGFYVFEKQD